MSEHFKRCAVTLWIHGCDVPVLIDEQGRFVAIYHNQVLRASTTVELEEQIRSLRA